MWGWGVMNSVAVTEAASIGFPMDHFIGVWWSGAEPDVLPAGAGADGYKAINFTGVGMDFPFYADLKEYVIDAGKGAGDGIERRHGAVQPRHLRGDAGGGGGAQGAGAGRDAGHHAGADARRHGGA